MPERKKANAKQIAHQNDYNRANYDRLSVMLPKGARDTYRDLAARQGVSLNALIVSLLERELKENS